MGYNIISMPHPAALKAVNDAKCTARERTKGAAQ